jgi:predicted acyl esterase
MSGQDKVFVPSHEFVAGPARGILSPFEPGTRTLPAGWQIDPRFKPLDSEIVLDKDVAVPLRDGANIRVDVLRPPTEEKVPAIVAWSPYGKSGGTGAGTTSIFALVGLDNSIVSGLEKFEGPDPAYWCAHGYAICNPDPRGIAESDGDSYVWDRQEGRDCHDLIEWLAAQEWCNGKVAMSGTSYLAAAQWFTAAEQPPHLAAINPWEGISDVYRDLVLRGGMLDTGFAERLTVNYAGKGRREDIVAEAEQHPFDDGWWADKEAELERIEVPAYVVASYTNTLHCAGTFRGWRRIASEEKWLRIHASQEWPDYYDETNVEDLRRFFDHYLKGADNGWTSTPRVRYSVLDLVGDAQTNLPASEFPPEEVTDVRYYLHGGPRILSSDAPSAPIPAAYEAAAPPAQVSFLHRFNTETTFVGYPKAHLWVEVEGADDADLFVLVQKLSPNGTPLREFTVPNRSARVLDATEGTASVLVYRGSPGQLRVSMRGLDEQRATPTSPEHRFDSPEKLAPGEVVEVEVDLLPIGLVFRPSEQLRLVISARNLTGGHMPGRFYNGATAGNIVIHTGGDRASYLQLPVLAG